MEKELILSGLQKIKENAVKHWKVTVAVLVVLIFVNLLYVQESIVRNHQKDSNVLVLRTYKTTGNTFYKKQNSKKWLFLSGEELLSAGSEIQTDLNSHAILSFVGQSGRAELSEKTHVEVSKKDSDTVIDFKKGEIYINYQAGGVHKPLLVKVNQRLFRLTNADLYIRGDVEEQVQASVDYGKVNLTNGKQASVLEKGQIINFRSEKDYAVEETKVNFSTPYNYDRYNLVENEFEVRFAFSNITSGLPIQLFAGPSPDTLIPQFISPREFPKNEFTHPFKMGSYYWRLAFYDKNQIALQTPIKRFFVEPQLPIQPVKPLNSKFQLVDGKASVQFQWDNPSQLEKVFIEVSDNKDFSKTFVNEAIYSNNYFNYDFESAGEYFWRVSGFQFGTTELLQSAVATVSIVNEVVPQQMRILFPRNKVILTSLSLKNSDITFQWTKNPATDIYHVEIASLFSGKIEHFETADTQIKIKDLEPGKYTWKVYDRKSKLVSAPEEFNVVPTKRLNFAKESEGFGFLSWQAGPRGTSAYRVEVLRIGSRSDFNAFFDDKSVTKRSLEVKGDKISYKNFSDGIYAFKVYALDAKKNILADSNLKFLKVGNEKK